MKYIPGWTNREGGLCALFDVYSSRSWKKASTGFARYRGWLLLLALAVVCVTRWKDESTERKSLLRGFFAAGGSRRVPVPFAKLRFPLPALPLLLFAESVGSGVLSSGAAASSSPTSARSELKDDVKTKPLEADAFCDHTQYGERHNLLDRPETQPLSYSTRCDEPSWC